MSLIPTTYNGLVSAVRAIAADNSQEFLTYIPTAIYLAEERLMKELDTQGIETVVTVNSTSGNPYLVKPSGFRVVQETYLVTASGVSQPTMKTVSFIKDYWPTASETGTPKYIGSWSEDEWIVAPTPDQNYKFIFNCVKDLDHLTETSQTNYFSARCPDALFYATMSHMAEFMKDYAVRDTVWEPKLARAMEGLNNQARRARRSSSDIPQNPTDNTLTGTV